MKFVAAYRSVANERYFLRYFVGESVSSVGDAMSEVTIVVLALAVAEGDTRAIAVAAASAAYLFPGVVSGVVSGKAIGRFSPRTLALVDNGWRALWVGVAALLATADLLHLWAYVLLLGLASITRPFGAAGSRGIVAGLVDHRNLFAANSLLGGAVQIATMLGPAAAGFLIAAVGPGPALAADAASFLFCVGALLSIHLTAHPSAAITEPSRPVTRHENWHFWARQRVIVALFVNTSIMLLLYGPVVVGLPIIADQRAGTMSSATVLGLIWSAFGVGAVIGGLVSGGRTTLATVRTACLISAGWGLCTLLVGLPGHIAVAGVAMLVGGFVYAPYAAIVSTVMQRTLAPDRLVEASAYLESAKGVTVPLGIVLGGLAIAGWGASTTLIIGGCVLAVTALGIGLRWRDKEIPHQQEVAQAMGHQP